jgi:diguanylate cyclase (GGDEF)-like protein
METHIVLVVGAILLWGGCIGFVFAMLSNPFQRGLGWQGGMFACGAGAAAILASSGPAASDLLHSVTHFLILLAYVFLQVALCGLTGRKRQLPRLGIRLLVLQGIGDFLFHRLSVFREFSLVTLGLVLTIQAAQSILLLRRSGLRGVLAPARFIMALLVVFSCFNVYRSVLVLATGVPKDPLQPNPLQVTAAVVYLAVGLGLGFGVFWMAGAQLRQSLEDLANTDDLTGVANRRSFLGSCERELLRSERSGEPFSLILLDLDYFKEINDRYGHHAGDAVLCAIVECLRQSLRNVDLLGRWGGEEFAVLLPGADTRAALQVAEQLRSSVESLKIPTPRSARRGGGEASIGTTISAGVITYAGGVDLLDDLFSSCDKSLYTAKAQGRNQIVCHPI